MPTSRPQTTVVWFEAYGPPEALQTVTVDRPKPGPGEILVEVAAIGVNPADHKFRAGALAGHRPKHLPVIPGMDIAGVVTGLGEGVTAFAIGDPVLAMLPPSRLGGYASHVAASAGFFAKIPAGLDLVQAAALPTAGLTGVELIEDDLDVRAGMQVLIIGGLGGVGRAAAFAAKRRGAHVTLAVRRGREDEASFADAVITVGEAQDARFDRIADTVGGEVAGVYYGSLAAQGILSSVATVKLPACSRDDVITRNFVCYPDPQRLVDLCRAVADGMPVLQAIETRPLREAASVHGDLEKGSRGKFVLIP